MTEPLSLITQLNFAKQIRKSHNSGLISALDAEILLLDEGFYNIRFDAFGITSVCYQGVKYPLERSPA